MYYIDDRDLMLMLKELLDIRKEQLIKIRGYFRESLKEGRKPETKTEQRIEMAIRVIDIILEYK